MSWKFEIIDDIMFDWVELSDLSESSHVFFHPTMIKAWLLTYKPLRNMTPFIVKAVNDNNEAVLPMVIWRKNWKNAFQKVIVPMGYSDFDYHDPIFRYTPTQELLREYWDGLFKLIESTFSFDSLSTDTVRDSMISDEFNWEQGEICPLLRLVNIHNETELMSFFKTSLRGDIRRQLRRLEEIGPLEFREYNSFEDIPKNTFYEFIRQHSLRWPNAYKAPKFHENLLRMGLPAGIVHFSALSVNGIEIAWHLGFSYRGRYYYYMPAGNQEYFKYSPTKIHLFYLVKRAVEMGYEIFDHLRGEENYKSGWSNDSEYVNSVTIMSDSLSSLVKSKLLAGRRYFNH